MVNETAGISFPLVWRLALRLPRNGGALANRELAWPERGDPVLRAERIAFDGAGGWTKADPQLVFLETSDLGETRALAQWASAPGRAALAIVSGAAAKAEARRRTQEMTPMLALIAEKEESALRRECDRATDDLLTRAIAGFLVARLRAERARLSQAVARDAPLLARDGEAYPSAGMPPLASILSAHARRVGGVWWSRLDKPEHALDITRRTMSALRRQAPEGIERALRPEPETLAVWMVGGAGKPDGLLDSAVSEAWERCGVVGSVRRFASGREVRQAASKEGAPALAVVAVGIGGGDDGIALARWLATAGRQTVVVARCEGASAEEIRRVCEAGALAIELPIEWSATARQDARAALGESMEWAMRAAARVQRMRRLRITIDGLQEELAPMPARVGEVGVALDGIEHDAVAEALALRGTHVAAAKALGVCPKSITRLLQRTHPKRKRMRL